MVKIILLTRYESNTMEKLTVQILRERHYSLEEVLCCSGDKYDFSQIEYKNYIDCEFRDLKKNIPYELIHGKQVAKKYNIDTDNIEEVTIITLKDGDKKLRIVAPYALMEWIETISNKITFSSELVLVRTENQTIEVFMKV